MSHPFPRSCAHPHQPPVGDRNALRIRTREDMCPPQAGSLADPQTPSVLALGACFAPVGCRCISRSMLSLLSLASLCLALLQKFKSQKNKLGALRWARLDQVPRGRASSSSPAAAGSYHRCEQCRFARLTGLQVRVHRSLSGLKSLSSGLAPPRGPGGECISCLSSLAPGGVCIPGLLALPRSSQPASPHGALTVTLTFLPSRFSCEDPVDIGPLWVTQKNLPSSRPFT